MLNCAPSPYMPRAMTAAGSCRTASDQIAPGCRNQTAGSCHSYLHNPHPASWNEIHGSDSLRSAAAHHRIHTGNSNPSLYHTGYKAPQWMYACPRSAVTQNMDLHCAPDRLWDGSLCRSVHRSQECKSRPTRIRMSSTSYHLCPKRS